MIKCRRVALNRRYGGSRTLVLGQCLSEHRPFRQGYWLYSRWAAHAQTMRLNTTLYFEFNGIQLSPPPENAQPAVSASRAWRAADITQTSASYQLLLAQWHSTAPLGDQVEQLFDGLVWVVIGTNVRIPNRGPKGSPPWSLQSAMWPVDATTGRSFGFLGYPPRTSGPAAFRS
jgi:hypothetical protein